jgi:type IV secretory pathway VirB2 component (pilin)
MNDPPPRATRLSVTKLFWSSLRWMFAAVGLYALIYGTLALISSASAGAPSPQAQWAFKWLPVLLEPLVAIFYLAILVACGSALVIGWTSFRRR